MALLWQISTTICRDEPAHVAKLHESAAGIPEKARNDLAPGGKHPSQNDTNACYSGVRSLIRVVLNDTVPLLQLDLADHALSDPFMPKHTGPIEPEFWMEIPKLPR